MIAHSPDPRDVDDLTHLLDLLDSAPSNEQRARYLLTCNWMIDRGAAAATNAAIGLAMARERSASDRVA